jgi:hypothetical protein
MFINRTKRYVYLRVPKTGSTSIHNYLIDNKKDDDVSYSFMREYKFDNHNSSFKNAHPNLQDAINSNLLKIEDLSNYKIYGIIRNPIDRFISMVYHFYKGNKKKHQNDVVRDAINDYKLGIYPYHAQKDWLIYNNNPINNIFLYENINKMLTSILGTDVNIKYNHRSKYRTNHNYNDLELELQNTIKEIYYEDWQIYNMYKQKEVNLK